jgi:L-lysine 6-transaminase
VDMVRSSKIMEIIEEDNLCENAAKMGEYLQDQLAEIAAKYPIITNIRGKGL